MKINYETCKFNNNKINKIKDGRKYGQMEEGVAPLSQLNQICQTHIFKTVLRTKIYKSPS